MKFKGSNNGQIGVAGTFMPTRNWLT